MISAFAAEAFSASANYSDDLRRADIKDAVPKGTDTNRFYFYMPEEWRNAYNDAYDGKNLSSCAAGIYWWSGTANCDEYYKAIGQKSWPGYVVAEKEVGDPNIFVADCPKDVENIIFNNTVDGGEDKNDEKYFAANQTVNIYCESCYPEDDKYGFYPNGLESMDNMIFVCAPFESTTSELTKETVKGEWFYYYGGGKYGYLKTLAEAQANNAVFSGGKFPELTGKPAENDTPKVTPVQSKATVKVKNTMKVKAKNVTVKASKLKSKKYTFKAFTVTKAKGKVSYAKVSGATRLKLNSKTGKITVKKGTKKGTYKIKVKITVRGNSKYQSKTITKTIRIRVK